MQIRLLAGAVAAATMAGSMSAQTLTLPPAFEVASFKAHVPTGKRQGERIEVVPGSLIMGNVRFVTAVRWAYHVLEYQVSGPGWIEDERYDIVAKAATPVEENELRKMLQTLLTERCGLAIHRQTKEMQAYVVTVGKNGHKMQPSTTEGAMSVKPVGLVLTIERADLDEVAAMATQPLRGPVVNATGLKGKWDLKLDAAPYLADAANVKELPEMVGLAITAAREQLGLNVESKKTQVEMIVIDRADKVPIDN